ncbi:substrate-binding periplasmic protein [Thalassotalea piscium]
MFKYCLILLWIIFSQHVYAIDKLPSRFSIAAPEIPPLVYYNEDHQLVGSLVEKLNLFSRETGIDVSIDIMTWPRALAQVKNHRYDALMPALKTKEREAFLVYPNSALIHFRNSVLIEKKNQSSLDVSFKPIFKNKIVAKGRSMKNGKRFDDFLIDEEMNIIEVNSVEVALKMLDMGRVDFVAIDKDIATSVLKRLSMIDNVNFITIVEDTSMSYLAFSSAFSKKYDVNVLMEAILSINDGKLFNPHP